MIFCSYCGTTNRAGSRFCNQCGRPLPGPNLLCSRCQALITEMDKFCHNCGARLTEATRHSGLMSATGSGNLPGTTETESNALARGTFVESVDDLHDTMPPVATPTTPLRSVGSWHVIDNWVEKQIRQGTDVVEQDATQEEREQPADDARTADAGREKTVGDWRPGYVPSRQSRSAPRLKIGIRIDTGRKISRNQTIGILALLVAVGLVALWLLAGGRR